MPQFKIGDTVRLKSGSPLMTVTKYGNADNGPHVWTTYFSDDGKEYHGHYPADAVEADDIGPVIA